ncbi:MAG TPA: tRNA (adenosine(37)-N6)-threonylcarbamoyltransferase complex ATPase subunit type 1 TsaE [Patescibacteria group bacterium]|jgi:tRNA threonylcarbamoyladenosine biosynthesis protein TsaE|nr:tRNA (adenosine(37)-N6)-threonylcarbamoyltransferase complex ATPase subunit type 1 TsaE [Patescibacteria group bacterium]
MVTNISHSPAETLALGESWGRSVERGLVIALCGDLGAGKTQLVKGIAFGLGITVRVQSPTFTLVNSYPGGRLPLFHLDLYRLETPQLVLAAGLEEYLHPNGVTVIEWAERWFGKKPGSPDKAIHEVDGVIPHFPTSRHAALRWVQFEVLGESERRICYEDISA